MSRFCSRLMSVQRLVQLESTIQVSLLEPPSFLFNYRFMNAVLAIRFAFLATSKSFMRVAYVGLHFQVNAITMKQSLYLNYYQYIIPTSAVTLPLTCRKSDRALEQERPLLWVAV